MGTQAHKVAKFPDGSLSNGKLAEGQPRWSQTDSYLPRSDHKGKTEPVRIIFNIQAAAQGPNYLFWNAEQRLPELLEKSETKTGLERTTRVIGEQTEIGNRETLAWLAKIKSEWDCCCERRR